MDRKFRWAQVTLLHDSGAFFFGFGREKERSGEKLAVGFHSRLDLISTLNTNDELKWHLLLRQADLGSQDRNIIVRSYVWTTHSRPYSKPRKFPVRENYFRPSPWIHSSWKLSERIASNISYMSKALKKSVHYLRKRGSLAFVWQFHQFRSKQ